MHKDICQVLLIQEEDVDKPVGLYIGRAPVASAAGQQAESSRNTINTTRLWQLFRVHLDSA